jgi:hypothetical protein
VSAMVNRPAMQSALEAAWLQTPALQTAGGTGQTGARLKVVPVAEQVPSTAAGGSGTGIVHCWATPSTIIARV